MGLEQRPGQPVREKKPLNPLGEWLTSYASEKGTTIRKLGRDFDLPNLSSIPRKNETQISLFTIERVIMGAANTGATKEQLDALGDVVNHVIENTLAEKGKLYSRIPPSVPRRLSKELNCVTYTDTSLARKIMSSDTKRDDLALLRSRIFHLRNGFGYSTVFTEDEAEAIKKSIDSIDAKCEKPKELKSLFGVSIVVGLNIDRNLLGNSSWLFRENGIPAPEEFGCLLVKTNLTDEERERMVSLWLEEYRNGLTLSSAEYRKEFALTRQRIHQLAKKVDPEGKLSTWEKIEKIRKRRNNSEEGGKPAPVRLSELARELGVHKQTLRMAAIRLGIYSLPLTQEAIEKLKKDRLNPPKTGRPRKSNL